MQKCIPVFKTLSDTFKAISQNYKLYIKALTAPVTVMALVQVSIIYMINHISTIENKTLLLYCLFIIPAVAFSGTLMFNISSRITINGSAGHQWWKMTETRSMLKAGAVALYTVLADILLSLLFTITIVVALFSFESAESTLRGSEIWIGLFKLILSSGLNAYIGARFMLVFPATAIGKVWKVKEAWKLSKGNGWRLVMLTSIPMMLMFFTVGIWILIFSKFLYLQMTIVPVIIIFQIVTMTTVAVAYKKMATD